MMRWYRSGEHWRGHYLWHRRWFNRPFFAFLHGSYCLLEIEILGIVLMLGCKDRPARIWVNPYSYLPVRGKSD